MENISQQFPSLMRWRRSQSRRDDKPFKMLLLNTALYFLGYIYASSLIMTTVTANNSSPIYSSSSTVKLLTAQQLNERVVKSHDLHLVEFYADWCGHCKQFGPIFESVAKALRGFASVVAVKDEAAMKEFGVTGFPTIMVFVGRGGSKPKTFTYDGQRNGPGVLEFVLMHISKLAKARLAGKIDPGTGGKSSEGGGGTNKNPKASGSSDVIELKDSNFDKLVMKDNESVWFVEFYAPWCGHCKSLVPIWEDVATQLKGKVKVAKVDATSENAISSKFGIRGFPTLKLFPAGPKMDSLVKDYEGPRTADEIIKFALEYFSSNASANQILSDSQFREQCGESLCVLAFLPDVLDSGVTGRKQYLETFNQVVKSSINVPVKFLWLQGGDNFDVEEQLHLAFGWPAVVAVHLARLKFAVHRGNFSRDSINSFLLQLLAGRAPVSDLPDMKKLKNAKPWDAGAKVEETVKEKSEDKDEL